MSTPMSILENLFDAACRERADAKLEKLRKQVSDLAIRPWEPNDPPLPDDLTREFAQILSEYRSEHEQNQE